MLGYIIYGDGPKRPVLEEQRIAGGRFMVLRMGEPLRPKGPIAMRRARTAARRLREAGVRSAVFPMDFPFVPWPCLTPKSPQRRTVRGFLLTKRN